MNVSKTQAWRLPAGWHRPTVLLCGLLTLLGGWISSLGAAQNVTLAWDPTSDSNVAGYRVYAGTHPGVYTRTIEVGSATTAFVSGLVDGETYFFAVTAYHASGLESPPSKEISYTAPRPSPAPSPTPFPAPSPSSVQTPIISLSVSPSSVNPGTGATYTVTAWPTNPNASITVGYAMSGKAVMGAHYTLSGAYGQVTISAGASSAQVTLTALATNPPGRKNVTATMILQKGRGYKLSSSKKAVLSITPPP